MFEHLGEFFRQYFFALDREELPFNRAERNWVYRAAILPGVVDLLEKHGLKERIKVIASGKLITPAEVARAYCAGADFVATARGFMFALGCIQAMRCNKTLVLLVLQPMIVVCKEV